MSVTVDIYDIPIAITAVAFVVVVAHLLSLIVPG